MSRTLLTKTLEGFAKYLAVEFLKPDMKHPRVDKFIGGRGLVMQDFYNLTYKDEFAHVLAHFRGLLGPVALEEFDALAAERFTPRDDTVLIKELADRLAITPDGDHIPGRIGTSNMGSRVVGKRLDGEGNVKNAYWPIWAGEEEERAADSDAVDALPPPQ